MTYEQLTLKEPKQSDDYDECSEFVITAVEAIVDDAIKAGNNRIIINTNLKLGLPMENINNCLLYTSPSPRDRTRSRMPSSA